MPAQKSKATGTAQSDSTSTAEDDLREFYVTRSMLRMPMTGNRVLALVKPKLMPFAYSMVLEFRKKGSLYPVTLSDTFKRGRQFDYLLEASSTRFNLSLESGLGQWHMELTRRRGSNYAELYDAAVWANDAKHKGFDWTATGFDLIEIDAVSYNAQVLKSLVLNYLDELGL